MKLAKLRLVMLLLRAKLRRTMLRRTMLRRTMLRLATLRTVTVLPTRSPAWRQTTASTTPQPQPRGTPVAREIYADYDSTRRDQRSDYPWLNLPRRWAAGYRNSPPPAPWVVLDVTQLTLALFCWFLQPVAVERGRATARIVLKRSLSEL